MYTTQRKAAVRLWYGGQEQGGWFVGVGRVRDGRQVFGLCSFYAPEHISHVAYGLDYVDSSGALARAQETGWFWFDAGTTCPEIKISVSELKRALHALGLLDEPKPAVDALTEIKDIMHRWQRGQIYDVVALQNISRLLGD